MKIITCLFILQGIFANSLSAQYIPLKKFGVKEGLPTNFIYRTIQDKKGNLWVCTSEGISKYDGYTFKNFSVKNGLPHNDVYNLIEDKQGRIWINNDRNQIAYIKDEKIVNFDFENAWRISVVKREKDYTDLFNQKDILRFYSNDSLAILPRETILHSDEDKDLTIDFRTDLSFHLRKILVDIYRVRETYMFQDNFVDPDTYGQDSIKFINKKGHLTGSYRKINYPESNANPQVVFIPPDESELQVSAANYLTIFDSTFQIKNSYELPIKGIPEINSMFMDANKNIWISTISGLYFADKNLLNQSTIIDENSSGKNISSVFNFKGKILFTTTNNELFFSSKQGVEFIYSAPKLKVSEILDPTKQFAERIFLSKRGMGLVELKNTKENNFHFEEIELPINFKKFNFHENGLLYVTTRFKFYTYDLEKKKIDTVAIRTVDDFFITEDQLTFISQDSVFTFQNDKKPFINNRIKNPFQLHYLKGNTYLLYSEKNESYLCENEEINEIKFLRNIKIITVLYENSIVWILHSEGLIKSRFTESGGLELIQRYNIKNSLNDFIFTDFVKDQDIFTFGTDNGILELNLNKWSDDRSVIPIYIDSISTGFNTYTNVSEINVPFSENSIVINTTCISLREINNVVYHYRLKGVEEGFIQTKSQIIRYPDLNPGSYDFEIYATDSQAGKSALISTKITVRKPWYNSFLFYGVCLSAIGGLLYYLYKTRENQLLEKSLSNQKFAELELNALQSQMNPHFVFNAMGSLQNLVQSNQQELADRYIAKFAKLMRMYLESSKSKFISLGAELEIVNAYFDLEKLRFDDKINLQVINELGSLDIQQQIPASLIQPFVENAINHGLFHKNGKGLLQIHLIKKEDIITIIIRDNGIGRDAAGIFKKKSGNHNPSRALEIISEKISAIQKLQGTNINYNIVDLTTDGKASGTEIIIRIGTTTD